jgi:hypothetical protein
MYHLIQNIVVGAVYEHYKGNNYRVLHVSYPGNEPHITELKATHSESLQEITYHVPKEANGICSHPQELEPNPLVIYQGLDPERKIWARPLQMWNQEVNQVPRFLLSEYDKFKLGM